MSILVNKNSRVVVQGITGSEGTFHAAQMLEYGTNIVAGVTPGKGGQSTIDGKVPVFNSVEEAKIETAKLIATLRASEEGQEGMQAFLQKRKPKWTS